MASVTPDLRFPSQPQNTTAPWPVLGDAQNPLLKIPRNLPVDREVANKLLLL